MKFGLYVGSRAGATCAGPADPLRIGPLIDELSGGHPFVIREYVHWCGGNTALEQEIDASLDLDHLTMPDDWYVTGGRELDLVLSYLPPTADLDGWLTFIDRVLDRYGHLVRYLQVTLEANFPIPHIDGSSPGVIAALTQGLPYAREPTLIDSTLSVRVSPVHRLPDFAWFHRVDVPHGPPRARSVYSGRAPAEHTTTNSCTAAYRCRCGTTSGRARARTSQCSSGNGGGGASAGAGSTAASYGQWVDDKRFVVSTGGRPSSRPRSRW
jgi:hypothetical protein